MASEIQLAYGTTGRTLYAVIRNATGAVWNGSAFGAYSGGSWSTYAVTMTEQGTSGYYAGDFPAVAAGVYLLEVRDRAGVSPATTDVLAGSGIVEWSGTALVPLSSRSTFAAGGDVNVTQWAGGAVMGSETGFPVVAVGYLTDWGGSQAIGDADVSYTSAGNARVVDSAGNDIPTAAQVATAVLAAGDIDGFTLEQTLKLCLSALAGKLSGAATTTITIRAADDSKNRIVATVDSDGNRSAITLDAAG